MKRGEVLEVDLDDVVDVDAEVLRDGLGREARAAVGVGGVDLVAAVAGDVDDRVARDREARGLPAADAHEHDRVRPRRLADLVGAGLLRVLRARVGAEHEDRVRRGQREAGVLERAAGRVVTPWRWTWAEIRNSSSESSSQPTIAAADVAEHAPEREALAEPPLVRVLGAGDAAAQVVDAGRARRCRALLPKSFGRERYLV